MKKIRYILIFGIILILLMSIILFSKETKIGTLIDIDPLWISGTEVGDKIVKELCNPVYKTWTDEIKHYKTCTQEEVYNPINKTTSKAYNYTCLDYIEKIEYKNEQVECKKTGKVTVSGKLIEEKNRWCKLEGDEICCMSNLDGGRYGAFFRTDGSVDKKCRKVEDI